MALVHECGSSGKFLFCVFGPSECKKSLGKHCHRKDFIVTQLLTFKDGQGIADRRKRIFWMSFLNGQFPEGYLIFGSTGFLTNLVSDTQRHFVFLACFRQTTYLSPNERLRAWNTQRPSDSSFRLADRCRLLPSAHYLPHPTLLATDGF